jgi:hypothetical protein
MMQLGSKYGLLVPAETSVLKNNLAQIILASACTGERYGAAKADRLARSLRHSACQGGGAGALLSGAFHSRHVCHTGDDTTADFQARSSAHDLNVVFTDLELESLSALAQRGGKSATPCD